MVAGRQICRIATLLAGCVACCSAARSVQAASAEAISLVTKDGVQLKATYFPAAQRAGAPEARQVTPVVLLHNLKETRANFNSLAQQLQAVGGGSKKGPSFAAITVDLRGHGESTQQVFADGSQQEIDASRINKQLLGAMAAYDMEAVRSFLVGKNDAGELNLNKLSIVGVGLGANVAANWAWQDWAAPPLAIGKQGQDVKALVLVSPQWTNNGLSFVGPMKFRPLKQEAAWMLVYGAGDKKFKADAERIRKQLARFHPEPEDAVQKAANSLQVVAVKDSKLQGSTLLRQNTTLEKQIVDFLTQHVAKTQQLWSNRLGRLPQ